MLEILSGKLASCLPERVVCLMNESRRESFAPISRIAIGLHRHIRLTPHNMVAFLVTVILGNQRQLCHAMDKVFAEVPQSSIKPTSGSKLLSFERRRVKSFNLTG